VRCSGRAKARMGGSPLISVFYGREGRRLGAGRSVALALVLSACAHANRISNAYAPFGRDLAVAPAVLTQRETAALQDATISELIAAPERYHRARVRTEGYLRLQFEGNTLCPAPGRPGDWKTCLWLDVDGMKDPGFRHGHAIVEGRFDGENLGHLGLVSGAIEEITSVRRQH